jgi:hypothetical protein
LKKFFAAELCSNERGFLAVLPNGIDEERGPGIRWRDFFPCRFEPNSLPNILDFSVEKPMRNAMIDKPFDITFSLGKTDFSPEE